MAAPPESEHWNVRRTKRRETDEQRVIDQCADINQAIENIITVRISIEHIATYT